MAKTAPHAATTRFDAIGVERSAHDHHDPKAEEQPKRITPHGNGAASAQCRQRDHNGTRPEREERHDAAVEGVGGEICSLGMGRGHSSPAAIKNDGTAKKIWPAANIAGCTIWSNQPRAGEARASP